MAKTAVIYWSGTGNTEAMAAAILEGMKSAGADAVIYTPATIDTADALKCGAVALGCPAMGLEVLEEEEFQPMWDKIKGSLISKKVVLFGSYGWGDGEWMRSWEADARAAGIELAAESLLANNEPDEAALTACRALGASLA